MSTTEMSAESGTKGQNNLQIERKNNNVTNTIKILKIEFYGK